MNLITLLRKEYLENIRNHKLLSVLLIFSFFGIVSPLSAYYIPDIVSYFTKSQNITIEIPPPTYKDALFQYIKNISQMCVFILILMYMGIVSNEKDKGTAVFVLVKPVLRSHFITAKYISVISICALALCASAFFTALYTQIFFGYFAYTIFFIQNVLILLYLITILSITLMFSTIFKSQIISGILSFLVWISFTLISQFGKAGIFSPDFLIQNASFVSSLNDLNEKTIFSSIIIIIFTFGIAVLSFRKWEAK